jgi:hypothetical protein
VSAGRRARAVAGVALLAATGCASEGGGLLGGALFACVPAESVGEPGALLTPEQLPADRPVSAMLVWERSLPSEAAERATGAGAEVIGTFRAHRALAVRATGAQLVRLRRELAGAQVYLASTGTSQLCVQRRG